MNEAICLYLEIFQPYAQYRNPFTFYYAQSYPLPPKSTIIGMLQNAVNDWYGSNFGLEVWWNLKVSIHGGFESFFWNYQQLIKGYPYLVIIDNKIYLWNNKKPLYNDGIKSQRTPIYQQELFNGHLFIFIKATNEKEKELLKVIKKSLENPKKILYLGRSEDIVFIKDVRFIEPKEVYPNNKIQRIESDIKLTYPTYIKANNFPIKNMKYPVYSIPIEVIFKNNGNPVKHKSEINKQTKREVKFEKVIYTGFDYSIILKDKLNKIEVYEIEKSGNKHKFLIIDEFGWL